MPREKARAVKRNKKKNVAVTGDYLLNGTSEKGLSRNHQETVKNFLDITSEKILYEKENLVADKSDCFIIHAGTSDITN